MNKLYQWFLYHRHYSWYISQLTLHCCRRSLESCCKCDQLVLPGLPLSQQTVWMLMYTSHHLHSRHGTAQSLQCTHSQPDPWRDIGTQNRLHCDRDSCHCCIRECLPLAWAYHKHHYCHCDTDVKEWLILLHVCTHTIIIIAWQKSNICTTLNNLRTIWITYTS